MRTICASSLLPAALTLASSCLSTASAQTRPDPRVADLVATGKLRVGLFASQFVRDPLAGKPASVRVDLAEALARELGVSTEIVQYRAPSDVIACLESRACDLVFLPRDERSEALGEFSNPVLLSEYTLLVPAGSSIRSLTDADVPGAHIAAVRGHASTAALAGLVGRARIVEGDDETAAIELIRSGRATVLASTRQSLIKAASLLPGHRVLAGRYGANVNRMVVPKGKLAWIAVANEFVERAKSSGLVQQAIDRDRSLAFQVPPPGDPSESAR